jgi:hypothetical protein
MVDTQRRFDLWVSIGARVNRLRHRFDGDGLWAMATSDDAEGMENEVRAILERVEDLRRTW